MQTHQAGEESDPNYRGCGALFVSGKAPSEACGMRWSFGVYMRLPQCPSRYHHACGDWGGHPVYQHVWKTNYLWGDFDMNWFIGAAKLPSSDDATFVICNRVMSIVTSG